MKQNARRGLLRRPLEAPNFPIVEQAIVHNSPDFEGGEKAMIDLLSYNSNLTAVVSITIQWPWQGNFRFK